MERTEIYNQIAERALPLISAWKDDLLVHDLSSLTDPNNNGIPFIHITRDTGTSLTFLISADKYPDKGQTVPFMFGKADRRDLLKSIQYEVQHYITERNPLLVLFYNGLKLIEISPSKALDLIVDYHYDIQRAFDCRKAV
jgi:hypothetical protein